MPVSTNDTQQGEMMQESIGLGPFLPCLSRSICNLLWAEVPEASRHSVTEHQRQLYTSLYAP